MSWKKVKLSDITDNLDSLRVPLNETERRTKEKDGKYPYVGANNILGYINEYVFDQKILCIAEDGGSWGKNQKCSFILNEKCWVNNHAHVLVAKNGASLDYLKHYLNYADLNSYITGTTRGKLTKSALNSIQVPLPSDSTQQKIASILDKADELRRKDHQLLAKYDELLQSIFYQMFGDPVKNEKGFEKGTIRQVVSEVKYGTSKPAEDNGKYPYLRMNNITYNGDWDFSSLKYINLTKEERNKYLVRKNDLVFNRTNSKELVGKAAVYSIDDEMAIAGYLIRVRTNEKANPFYLSAYLNSKHGKATLMGMCKNIIGMANINAQELQDIEILMPNIDLQNEFAVIVQGIQSQKQQVKQEIEYSESLFQSLLQKAFKGELVN